MSFQIGDSVIGNLGQAGVVDEIESQDGATWYAVAREGRSGKTRAWFPENALRLSDPVQSPPHYDLPGGIQVIDLIRGESFLRGNIIKYVMRAPHKGNELEDMRKASEYLKWEIERLEIEQSS